MISLNCSMNVFKIKNFKMNCYLIVIKLLITIGFYFKIIFYLYWNFFFYSEGFINSHKIKNIFNIFKDQTSLEEI